jgi:hypothetical protein
MAAVELKDTQWYINSNLKAYFRFESGALTTDSSGEGHTLTAISDPAEDASGKFGGAVALDGDDAYSATDHADFKPTGVFSVGGWVKTSYTSDDQFIFCSYNPTNFSGWYLRVNNEDTIRFVSGRGTGTTLHTHWELINSTTTVTNGAWRFIVATWDGSKLHLYIDGAEEGTGVTWANAPGYNATNNVRIGCYIDNTNYFFNGSLDDVFLINGTALSADQIESIYDGTASTTTSTSITTSTSSSSSSSSSTVSTSSSSSSVSTSSSSSSKSTSSSSSTVSTSSSSVSTSSSSSTISTSSSSSTVSTSSSSSSVSTSSSSVSLSTSSSSSSSSVSTSSSSSSISTSSTLPGSGGLAFGEQSPTGGELPEEWTTWDDGSGGAITVIGDANWGKLELNGGEEGRSLVYDFGNSILRTFTLTENKYGTGQGSALLQIRGSDTVFTQDDNVIEWVNYTAPTNQSWRFIQVRTTK